jgi:hypothetical protein
MKNQKALFAKFDKWDRIFDEAVKRFAETRHLASSSNEATSETCPISQLTALVEKWRTRARWHWSDSVCEMTEIGKRLLEHRAISYLNCAADLTELIQALPAMTNQLRRPALGGEGPLFKPASSAKPPRSRSRARS